jgi:4-amino-4-deoxy-L-arabinose transferase-like glycosyltransferase
VSVVLGLAVFGLYSWRLGEAPVYLSPDEAIISVDAHTLASTGYDVQGERLPLYFKIQMPGETRWGWFTPAIFYVSALFQRVLRLSEWAVRLPTVCVGVVDVILLYWVGRKIFRSDAHALFAAGVLALAPAHFMLSRYALDYVYPLPFLLAWLFCLLAFVEESRLPWLFAASALLGIGFYSYIASVVMMPLYLALTGLVLLRTRQPARAYAIAAIAFALPLLPFVVWFLNHPTALSDTAARYELYDARTLGLLRGVRDFFGYLNLDRRSGLYWSYFNPSFLFFSGDSHMTFSTRSVGVLLMPLAVLLPLGVYQAIVRRPAVSTVLVLIGFVTAPVAAVLVPESSAIIRATALLPFAALLAALGMEFLWSAPGVSPPKSSLVAVGSAGVALGLCYGVWMLATRGRVGTLTVMLTVASSAMLAAAFMTRPWHSGRLVASVLAVFLPIQFGSFWADYFTDYRVRSNYWLGGNVRGALEQLIDRAGRDRAARVYFATLQSTAGLMDTRNRWMDAYWRFYLVKQGREDLLDRSARLESTDVRTLPAHSLVLANIGDRTTEAYVSQGELRRIAVIPEMEGDPFFAILERP